MNTEDRIKALLQLGSLINQNNKPLEESVTWACLENPWFTTNDYWHALSQIHKNYLQGDHLFDFAVNHKLFKKNPQSKNVGIVMAGNIPLVGFHDLLCTFLCGHRSLVKLSEKDDIVMPSLLNMWHQLVPSVKPEIEFVDKLQNFDAVIATGSNNTSRYFNYYFKNYPNIIRKNRNGVGVLTGQESRDDLVNLADDVLRYFGMGCRNVSKIYVPEGYIFTDLLDALKVKEEVIDHHKYKHNYDYNLAILQINQKYYMTNGSIILLEKEQIPSRISTLHFQSYKSISTLANELNNLNEQIQCVVSAEDVDGISTQVPGAAQQPGLADFADGVDTLDFLIRIAT